MSVIVNLILNSQGVVLQTIVRLYQGREQK